jgi:hypothetical protein
MDRKEKESGSREHGGKREAEGEEGESAGITEPWLQQRRAQSGNRLEITGETGRKQNGSGAGAR